jgi:hypothetical protein
MRLRGELGHHGSKLEAPMLASHFNLGRTLAYAGPASPRLALPCSRQRRASEVDETDGMDQEKAAPMDARLETDGKQ